MFTLKNKNLQAGIVLALVWLGVFIASYAQNQLAGMSVQFMEHYGFTSVLITPILLRRSTCRCYTVPRLADTCRCGNR